MLRRCSHGAVRRPRRAASNNSNAPQGRGYNVYEMRSQSVDNKVSPSVSLLGMRFLESIRITVFESEFPSL
jgi:hypothetical protein